MIKQPDPAMRAHTIREMIHEALLALGGSHHDVSWQQITRYIRERYPRVPEGAILPADYCRRMGRHVPPRYRFLWQTRRGWYRMAADDTPEAITDPPPTLNRNFPIFLLTFDGYLFLVLSPCPLV